MLSLSMLLVALGVYTTTRAESLNVSGYGSGVIVSSVSLRSADGLAPPSVDQNTSVTDRFTARNTTLTEKLNMVR